MPYDDGGNARRTIPEYDFPYESNYVQQEKEYLKDLGNRIVEHMESVGQPGHDPLASPINFDSSGIAAITKGQMLKKLGRGVSSHIRQMKNLPPSLSTGNPVRVKNLKSRTKAVAAEIRSAPDDLYDDLSDFGYAQDLNTGARYSPSSNDIVIGSNFLRPGVLRHETAHMGQKQAGLIKGNEYANQSYHASADLAATTTFPGMVDEMSAAMPHVQRARVPGKRGRESYFDDKYAYLPMEIHAVNMEDVPLRKFKSSQDYLDSLKNSYADAMVERDARRGLLFRRLKELLGSKSFGTTHEDWLP